MFQAIHSYKSALDSEMDLNQVTSALRTISFLYLNKAQATYISTFAKSVLTVVAEG